MIRWPLFLKEFENVDMNHRRKRFLSDTMLSIPIRLEQALRFLAATDSSRSAGTCANLARVEGKGDNEEEDVMTALVGDKEKGSKDAASGGVE